MVLITDISEIRQFITYIKLQHKDFLSNFYLSQDKQELYISEQLLYFQKYSGTVFLFLCIHDYYKLYYFSSSYDALKNDIAKINCSDKIIVCELIGRESLYNEQKVLKDAGFTYYSRLIHFTKKMNNFNRTLNFPKNMRYACIDDFNGIKSIMNNQFNKYVDVNMIDAEIINYINNKSVIIVEYNKEVAGFTIFNIKSGRVHAIMGGVKNEYKGTYISVMLFDFVFRLYDNSKFFSGFVREDNEYLLNYYRKSKYIEDGLYSVIFYKECGNKKIEKIIPMN